VALHTADPGDAGTMTTSETTYGNYARVPLNKIGADPPVLCPVDQRDRLHRSARARRKRDVVCRRDDARRVRRDDGAK
jgi:hypothetical protein